MKKTNIRKGVFETNSSSSHSICIPEDFTNEMLDTLLPNEEGVLSLYGDEFGGGGECVTDAVTKANYLAIYCHQYYPDAEINGKVLKDILTDVIKKQTGCVEVSFDNCEGYIDHESVDSANWHWVFQDDELVRNFIFNREAELKLDYNG